MFVGCYLESFSWLTKDHRKGMFPVYHHISLICRLLLDFQVHNYENFLSVMDVRIFFIGDIVYIDASSMSASMCGNDVWDYYDG